MTERLEPHPDRLFPADPATRSVARELYSLVADEHIFSPHGHVDPGLLLADEPFADPTALLVTPDHYVTRVLHAQGVDLGDLGVGGGAADPRAGWRILCRHWDAFLGTPSRYWLECELAEIFGVDVQLSDETADATYDAVAACLTRSEFRPRALFERFGIDVLATTDDPLSDLAAHRALAADPTFRGTVVPTFRPDRFLDPTAPGWAEAVAALGDATGSDTADFGGFTDALRARRAHFVEHGATATDLSMPDVGSRPLDTEDARRLHARALTAGLGGEEARAYRHHMLFEMARMSTEDGLVMQLHSGVLRNHHAPTLRRFGPDTGHDLPRPTSFTEGLRPLLEAFGTDPALRIVLFTVDEAAIARDIAPLAGFYPGVYAGAPWWFLDTPDAIARYRSVVTEGAGFRKSAGFVDDTRAFCSIPARHDMARRMDAGYLARLVCEHRISRRAAARMVREVTVDLPRRVFARTVA